MEKTTIDIRDKFNGKLLQNEEEAIDFALTQFYNKNKELMKRRFVPLFILDGGGYAYNPVEKGFYHVDPDINSEKYTPNQGDFVLFERNGKIGLNTDRAEEAGIKPFIYKLKPSNVEEIVEAHKYDDNNIIGVIKEDFMSKIIQYDNQILKYLNL